MKSNKKWTLFSLIVLSTLLGAYHLWSHVRYEVEYINLIDKEDPSSQIHGWKPGMITKEDALREALNHYKLEYSSKELITVELVPMNDQRFHSTLQLSSQVQIQDIAVINGSSNKTSAVYVVTIPPNYLLLGDRLSDRYDINYSDPMSVVLDPWTGKVVAFIVGLNIQNIDLLQGEIY